MSEEIFDVVNELDEVIGQQPRSEVHRQGLQHRAVHVLLLNARGQVFLQKRSLTKDRQPGFSSRHGAAVLKAAFGGVERNVKNGEMKGELSVGFQLGIKPGGLLRAVGGKVPGIEQVDHKILSEFA